MVVLVVEELTLTWSMSAPIFCIAYLWQFAYLDVWIPLFFAFTSGVQNTNALELYDRVSNAARLI